MTLVRNWLMWLETVEFGQKNINFGQKIIDFSQKSVEFGQEIKGFWLGNIQTFGQECYRFRLALKRILVRKSVE